MGLSQRGRTRRVTAKAGGFGARTGRSVHRPDRGARRRTERRAGAGFRHRSRGGEASRCGVGARRAPAAARRARHDQGILQRCRLPTTWGIPAAKDFIPPEDALAGAASNRWAQSFSARPMCLSASATRKATTPSTGRRTIRGTGRARRAAPRGSSAALAAGFGPLSLGSDIGGSLRVPAHFCGVCAHKPTFDLVPSRGHTPPGLPAWAGRTYLAVVGPMARWVDDLVLALDIIAGPDEAADGRAYRLNLPPARGEKLSDFRVLVIAEHPLLPTSAAIGASLTACRSTLPPRAPTSNARRRSFPIPRRPRGFMSSS